MHKISPIQALKDNYIWAITQDGSEYAIIIDPSEAAPVIDFLKQNNLMLDSILLTHHHHDHIGGVPALLDYAAVPVYGVKSKQIPHVTKVVTEGTEITFAALNYHLKVMQIPGHTLEHVAYYNEQNLFCGDTLFTGGCGRMFEGTPEQMYNTLQRLAVLGPQIQIYCGHEYTINNLLFALEVEPTNRDIMQRLAKTHALREQGLPTVPSTMATELATNPFLRTSVPAVIKAATEHAKQPLTSPIEVFAVLRAWKNNF